MSSITTIILVSNLHCSSCVNTVRETLSLLSPPPQSIHTSLISQSISIEHSPDLSVGVIRDALDAAGFDLVTTPEIEEYRLERSRSHQPSDWLSRKRQKHAEQCLLCKEEDGYTAGSERTLIPPSSADAQEGKASAISGNSKSAAQGPYNVTFAIGGITCSSCAANITHAVAPIQGVRDVAVDVIRKTATMTVDEPPVVDIIRKAIKDSGYDCELVNTDLLVQVKPREGIDSEPASQPEPSKLVPQQPSKPNGPFKALFSVDGMTCASCISTVTRAAEEIAGVTDVAVNLIGKSASATLQSEGLVSVFVSEIEDAGYEVELIKIEPVVPDKPARPQPRKPKAQRDQGPFQATFSIGGMTCVSCVTHVSEATSELEGVSDVAVNLVGKSATAILESRELVKAFINAVEEGGYEAELITIEPVATAEDVLEEDELAPRSVALRIDGMFCSHCPARAMKALERFGDKVIIDEPLGVWDSPNPVLRITYQPSPPEFTIRDITTAIASAKEPPFIVSIARPPSLEERAKAMHAREQRALLYRLASAFILAIPTFIIGIVFMTLVPASNRTRVFFMRPIWAGNVSRAEWALFILATPVMFYSAGQFHRRSIKEVYSLWRRGSRTPVLRRFVRFGSMNLLVSLGVSIAYFSSIALLVLAALEKRDASGMGDNTTYFDSVVFLTMFLLCGRFLEAYSKGRTADAITALGALRPSEALVLVPASLGEKMARISLSETATSITTDDARDLEKGTSESLAEVDSETLISDRQAGLRVQKVAVDLLEIGDIVRVPLGASPPADGTIVSSSGSKFDESSLTGESRPITKNVGDRVFVGTINRGNVVDVKIAALGGETMLDQIVKVVREGQTKRAPIERLADVLTGYFVPAITLLAILTWVIWLSLGFAGALPRSYLDIPVGGWAVWAMEFAIAVFVVACPCGIGLAAPTALLVGSGLAAKFGILVRGGGEAFQEAAQLDIIVFDKTGTLTQGGEPRITDAELDGGDTWNTNVLLSVAHELESTSSHPLALAIRRYCEEKEGRLSPISSDDESAIEEVGGKGLKGRFSSPQCEAIIGNEAWMSDHHATLSPGQETLLSQWKSEGKSVILLAISSSQNNSFTVVAIFAASDVLRPEARGVVSALQAQGLGTWMISGDNEITARAVARLVNIPETNVIAGVLPHQKAERIAWLQQVGQKRQSAGVGGRASTWVRKLREGLRLKIDPLNKRAIVAMVGDGINDAPALARADVGIAIGSGSDVAISSASFILVHSDLKSILTLTDLSRKVFRRVKFNFFWALVYNLIALPIAAGVIYPAHNSRLSPVWASLAMALSSVTVVLSSLMLRLYREPKIAV